MLFVRYPAGYNTEAALENGSFLLFALPRTLHVIVGTTRPYNKNEC